MYTFWFTCVTIHFNLKAFHWFIFELCLCLLFFWVLISLNFPFVFRIMSTCYYCYEFNCNPDSCNNYYIFYEYLPWNHKMLGTHSLNEFTWKTNLIFVFGFRFFSAMFDNSVNKGGPPGIGPINPRMNPPRGPSIGGPIPGAYGPGGMRGPPPGKHRAINNISKFNPSTHKRIVNTQARQECHQEWVWQVEDGRNGNQIRQHLWTIRHRHQETTV